MSSRIARKVALTLGLGALTAAPAMARDSHGRSPLIPGNLLVSESTYGPADITPGVTALPPGCHGVDRMPAGADGTFPFVFNHDSADKFFGITSPVFLSELTPRGEQVATIPVPDNQFVTSLSSKSELALNLSPEKGYVSFMGYLKEPQSREYERSQPISRLAPCRTGQQRGGVRLHPRDIRSPPPSDSAATPADAQPISGCLRAEEAIDGEPQLRGPFVT